jgi:hypothetical protein
LVSAQAASQARQPTQRVVSTSTPGSLSSSGVDAMAVDVETSPAPAATPAIWMKLLRPILI